MEWSVRVLVLVLGSAPASGTAWAATLTCDGAGVADGTGVRPGDAERAHRAVQLYVQLPAVSHGGLAPGSGSDRGLHVDDVYFCQYSGICAGPV